MNRAWPEHVSREQTGLEAQYVLPFIPSAHTTAGKRGDFWSSTFVTVYIFGCLELSVHQLQVGMTCTVNFTRQKEEKRLIS